MDFFTDYKSFVSVTENFNFKFLKLRGDQNSLDDHKFKRTQEQVCSGNLETCLLMSAKLSTTNVTVSSDPEISCCLYLNKQYNVVRFYCNWLDYELSNSIWLIWIFKNYILNNFLKKINVPSLITII